MPTVAAAPSGERSQIGVDIAARATVPARPEDRGIAAGATAATAGFINVRTGRTVSAISTGATVATECAR